MQMSVQQQQAPWTGELLARNRRVARWNSIDVISTPSAFPSTTPSPISSSNTTPATVDGNRSNASNNSSNVASVSSNSISTSNNSSTSRSSTGPRQQSHDQYSSTPPSSKYTSVGGGTGTGVRRGLKIKSKSIEVVELIEDQVPASTSSTLLSKGASANQEAGSSSRQTEAMENGVMKNQQQFESNRNNNGNGGGGEESLLEYGPGIVQKLRSRYQSLALRNNSNRPSLRRSASLENCLDAVDGEVLLESTPSPNTPSPVPYSTHSPMPLLHAQYHQQNQNSNLQNTNNYIENGLDHEAFEKKEQTFRTNMTFSMEKCVQKQRGRQMQNGTSANHIRSRDRMRRARSVDALHSSGRTKEEEDILEKFKTVVQPKEDIVIIEIVSKPSYENGYSSGVNESRQNYYNSKSQYQNGHSGERERIRCLVSPEHELPPPDIVRDTARIFEKNQENIKLRLQFSRQKSESPGPATPTNSNSNGNSSMDNSPLSPPIANGLHYNGYKENGKNTKLISNGPLNGPSAGKQVGVIRPVVNYNGNISPSQQQQQKQLNGYYTNNIQQQQNGQNGGGKSHSSSTQNNISNKPLVFINATNKPPLSPKPKFSAPTTTTTSTTTHNQFNHHNNPDINKVPTINNNNTSNSNSTATAVESKLVVANNIIGNSFFPSTTTGTSTSEKSNSSNSGTSTKLVGHTSSMASVPVLNQNQNHTQNNPFINGTTSTGTATNKSYPYETINLKKQPIFIEDKDKPNHNIVPVVTSILKPIAPQPPVVPPIPPARKEVEKIQQNGNNNNSVIMPPVIKPREGLKPINSNSSISKQSPPPAEVISEFRTVTLKPIPTPTPLPLTTQQQNHINYNLPTSGSGAAIVSSVKKEKGEVSVKQNNNSNSNSVVIVDKVKDKPEKVSNLNDRTTTTSSSTPTVINNNLNKVSKTLVENNVRVEGNNKGLTSSDSVFNQKPKQQAPIPTPTPAVAQQQQQQQQSELRALQKTKSAKTNGNGGGNSLIIDFTKSSKNLPDYLNIEGIVTDESQDDEIDAKLINFVGSNVIINGKSSIQKKPKSQKLNISFSEESTTTFEYPSEASILEVEEEEENKNPTPKGQKTLINNSGSTLGSYTPSKMSNLYQLGNYSERSVDVKTLSDGHSGKNDVIEDYLKPGTEDSAWSNEITSDILF